MSHDFDVITGESEPLPAEHAEAAPARPRAEARPDAANEDERGRHD